MSPKHIHTATILLGTLFGSLGYLIACVIYSSSLTGSGEGVVSIEIALNVKTLAFGLFSGVLPAILLSVLVCYMNRDLPGISHLSGGISIRDVLISIGATLALLIVVVVIFTVGSPKLDPDDDFISINLIGFFATLPASLIGSIITAQILVAIRRENQAIFKSEVKRSHRRKGRPRQ